MPIYEYQCEQCHRTLEKRQKFSDAALTECPHCGGKLDKLISAPAVQFKGGGWYADGYASSGGGSKAAASSEGGSSTASSSASGDSASSSAASSSAASSTPASAPAASTSATPAK